MGKRSPPSLQIWKTIRVNYHRLLITAAIFSLSADGLATGTRPQLAITVHHVSFGKGLPHGHARAIVQDHRGFIWIGTLRGLCRYDGYRVKVFTLIPPDSVAAIIDNRVDTLHLDHEGTIWVGTGSGIAPFDPLTERFGQHMT